MENNSLSQESINTLNELSQSFKPADVKFLVSNAADSLEECNDDAIPLIKGLQMFVNNNHSLEGLSEEIRSTFGEVRVYRTKDRM